jgi:hypothetical protein
MNAGPTGLPRRPLEPTGHQVTIFALGGEGVLRTYGRLGSASAARRAKGLKILMVATKRANESQRGGFRLRDSRATRPRSGTIIIPRFQACLA